MKPHRLRLAIALLIAALLIICTSSHRNKSEFFLDFVTGMSEQDYATLVNGYIRSGILDSGHSIVAGHDVGNLVYTFPSGQRGILFPYFRNDSLKGMTLNLEGDQLHRISIHDHELITDFITSVHGGFSNKGTDKDSGFEYTYWKDSEKNRVEMVYSSPDHDWPGLIAVVFAGREAGEVFLLSHVARRKTFAFIDNLKTCEEAEALAIHDYAIGKYRYVNYGLPSESTIGYVDLAWKKHGIEVLLGGCTSNESGGCYSSKMIRLLASRLGPYFIRDLRSESKKH